MGKEVHWGKKLAVKFSAMVMSGELATILPSKKIPAVRKIA